MRTFIEGWTDPRELEREVEEWCNHCHQVYNWIEGNTEQEFVWKCNVHDIDDFTGCRPCFEKHLIDTGY